MMEREARLCYHAVPRILPREGGAANTKETGTSSSEEKFIEVKIYQTFFSFNSKNLQTYLSSHRINMNIRQVH